MVSLSIRYIFLSGWANKTWLETGGTQGNFLKEASSQNNYLKVEAVETYVT